MPVSAPPRGPVAPSGFDGESDEDFLFEEEEFDAGETEDDSGDFDPLGGLDGKPADDETDDDDDLSFHEFNAREAERYRERQRSERQSHRGDRQREGKPERHRQTSAEDAAFARLRREGSVAQQELLKERHQTAQLSVRLNESTLRALRAEVAAKQEAIQRLYAEGETDKIADATNDVVMAQLELKKEERNLEDSKARLAKLDEDVKQANERGTAPASIPTAMLEWGTRLMVSRWPQELQLLAQEAIKEGLETSDLRPDDPRFFTQVVNQKLAAKARRAGVDIRRLVEATHRQVYGNPAAPQQRRQRPSPSGDGDGGEARDARISTVGPDGQVRMRALERQEVKFLQGQGKDPNDPEVLKKYLRRHPKPWRPARVLVEADRGRIDREGRRRY